MRCKWKGTTAKWQGIAGGWTTLSTAHIL